MKFNSVNCNRYFYFIIEQRWTKLSSVNSGETCYLSSLFFWWSNWFDLILWFYDIIRNMSSDKINGPIFLNFRIAYHTTHSFVWNIFVSCIVSLLTATTTGALYSVASIYSVTIAIKFSCNTKMIWNLSPNISMKL